MTKFGCNYPSSTTNRGVEAKEVEIANTRLGQYENMVYYAGTVLVAGRKIDLKIGVRKLT